MRKTQKRQIEEIIRQMEEAHGEMKRYIEKGIVAQVEELLADCQNAAVAIGTLIENTEGEEHPAVTVLEEYCELVYQIYEYLSSDSSVNANKIYKSLRQKLIKASNSIRNDIKIRTEAVFLPYKASMWDSLESVWKAADADPDCDAYVIPIPYFDKNPDGSFKEEHYEGNQYPNYVPITRYDAFDFGKHMPDVIYIHNGYDDWNLVTSVHPDFYSRNLKNYTEELVYIPYFVLGEIDPDDEQAAEGMKHFCFMPGIINADKVIVQSENMKKVYIREYLKAAKKYGLTGKHLDRTYLEKKFLGIGSPKFDKVLNTKKEDLEIPDEWLKIIKKPDGTWKKIVFYNTSISALLQYNERMLWKMEYVFRVFQKNREDVTLLWRPHPLIKATIESMRPQLWTEYDRFVRRYQQEGWGIYDDTADLNRAVALSDAYYGDGSSSVVQVCQRVNMPVMVQDVNTQNQNTLLSRFPCVIDCAYQEQNDVWFVGNEDNILWNMNMETYEIRYITSLPLRNQENAYRMYPKCIKVDEYIYCLPDVASEVVIYDLTKKRTEYININMNEKRIGIYNCWKQKDTIWCVSYFMQQIIEIDTNVRKIRGIYPIFKNAEMLIGYEAVMQGKYIYCTSRNTEIVCRFDTETKITEYFSLRTGDKGFNTITEDGDIFYLTGYRRAIYIWNQKNNSIEIIDKFPQEYGVLKKEISVNERNDTPIFFIVWSWNHMLCFYH